MGSVTNPIDVKTFMESPHVFAAMTNLEFVGAPPASVVDLSSIKFIGFGEFGFLEMIVELGGQPVGRVRVYSVRATYYCEPEDAPTGAAVTTSTTTISFAALATGGGVWNRLLDSFTFRPPF